MLALRLCWRLTPSKPNAPVLAAILRSQSTRAVQVLLDNGTFRVCPVPGKGHGLVAAKAIKSGSKIFEEVAMVRVNKNTQTLEMRQNTIVSALMQRVYTLAAEGKFDPRDFDSWPSEVCENLERVLDIQAEIAFSKLDPKTQAKWLSLEDSVTGDGRKTPGGVLRTNGFDDEHGYATLYEVLARVNHSCEPNAERIAGPLDRSLVRIVALADIAEGEEVLVSYVDNEAPLHVRRKHLQQQYKFTCGCPRCVKEAKGR
eukprot:scaffold84858_cov29-Tisochrysis_lutea.AAC.2